MTQAEIIDRILNRRTQAETLWKEFDRLGMNHSAESWQAIYHQLTDILYEIGYDDAA